MVRPNPKSVYLQVDLPQAAGEALGVQPPLGHLQPLQQRGPLHQQVGHLLTGAAQAHVPQPLLGQQLHQLLALVLWQNGEDGGEEVRCWTPMTGTKRR